MLQRYAILRKTGGGRRRNKKLRKQLRRLASHIPPTPYPNERFTTLVYTRNFDLQDQGSMNPFKAFRATNIIYPDVWQPDHNPYGYNLWNSLYRRFVVVRSRVRLRFMVPPLVPGPIAVGLYLSSTDVAPFVDVNTLQEQPFGDSMLVNPSSRYGTVPYTGPARAQLERSCDTAHFFNLKNIRDSVLYGGFLAQAYYIVWCRSVDPLAITSFVSFQIRIEYEVLYGEPRGALES